MQSTLKITGGPVSQKDNKVPLQISRSRIPINIDRSLTQTLTVVALSQTHTHMKLESFNGLFIKRLLVQRNVLNRTQYISSKHYEIRMRDFSSPGLPGFKGFG